MTYMEQHTAGHSKKSAKQDDLPRADLVFGCHGRDPDADSEQETEQESVYWKCYVEEVGSEGGLDGRVEEGARDGAHREASRLRMLAPPGARLEKRPLPQRLVHLCVRRPYAGPLAAMSRAPDLQPE